MTVRIHHASNAFRVRLQQLRLAGEAGMSTAEYAVGTLGAVAFAAALIGIVKSDAVRTALSALITGALAVTG